MASSSGDPSHRRTPSFGLDGSASDAMIATSLAGVGGSDMSGTHRNPDGSLIVSASVPSVPGALHHEQNILLQQPESATPVEVPVVDASAEKQGLFSMLSKMVGADLTTISMPVSVHEPTTFLQRMAEGLQYHHLLEEAGNTTDTVRQMTLTAAFAVASYSCNERTGKPFNPYLGETYQYDDGNVRFFAEQVSHHPPIGACVLEGKSFIFWQDMCVQTKFGGNQLDVSPQGEWHVRFKNNGNHIWWRGVTTVVYSIIIGTMWIDCFGDTELLSLQTGERAAINMTKCGWFSRGRWETKCAVYNRAGQQVSSFSGLWNSMLKMDGSGQVVWSNTLGAPRPGDKYSRPDHVFELIASPPALQARLPPTDSRFRKDLIALQQDDLNRAAAEKRALEERERALRRQRAAQGIVYKPRWFAQGVPAESGTGQQMWLFTGEYWALHGDPATNERMGPGSSMLQ